MQIVWNTFNHNEIGRRSLEDIIFILKHQMNALGHDAKWIPDNKLFAGAGNGVNIVIEGFVHAAQFARFKEKISPEICVGRALRHVGIEAPGRMAA